ncbi:putative Serine-threonine protein kinase, plant-type [Hibiscus syriacus]|uniref:Serine-threonine protein kinase, plant-type n=1 Tax=Hibiscus syriacus TaxID=106335 RepID=A0A6A3BIR6_HIBSY|nr:uncharacterized protein LOC120216822 [Hibiscus syriacus]XP_039070062.1 uncharacterized protein LOC120216822 [Hibiscus syriacus]KAE8715348.1 putative Serine-threonine protein kinase, plant-type [Hibiscus syriacus]
MTANAMENPVKSQKSKTYQKAKRMVAPFAFLFSIVVYASIFYVFSFSPSTLFNDNKFWFVISNTLILIIAADYCAFSSSKDQKRDFYEDYELHSQATRRTTAAAGASFVSQYPEIAKKSLPMEEEIASKENYKEDYHVTQTNNEIPENILEVVEIEPRTDNFQEKTQEVAAPMKAVGHNGTCFHHRVINKKKAEPKTIRRSKSERVKHVNAVNDKKGGLHRSKTEKQQDEPSGKDDEFSIMSNEELNRRVEEFIERFNREIRLQGVRNRQVLEFE